MGQNKVYFVTGTDTGVGKTFIASALLRAARARGLACVGYKPVAAGATLRDGWSYVRHGVIVVWRNRRS